MELVNTTMVLIHAEVAQLFVHLVTTILADVILVSHLSHL